MKKILFTCFIFLVYISYGQKQVAAKKTLLTSKYAGIFSDGTDIEKGRVGQVSVYAETDSTVLFYIEVNRGAPSYNMGTLYGRVKIMNDTGIFYIKQTNTENGCKWLFKFTSTSVMITTLEGQSDCGFGHGVFADDDYRKKTGRPPTGFINAEEKRIDFKTTSPEVYNEN